jgi:hypothetical protein
MGGEAELSEFIQANQQLIGVIESNCESKSLDYKGPMSWDTKDKKSSCGLVKDIIAIANTEGGCIVIGVAEKDEGFELTGVTSDQAGTFESTALCQFIQNYSDPPINVRVQKVSHKGNNFVIFEIPRFKDTPHICQKDFEGVLSARTLYVRTDNNESAPIQTSADFRALIENAIRNRTDSLLSSFRAILTSSSPSTDAIPESEGQFESQIEAARRRFDEKYPYKKKSYTFFVETVFKPESFDQYRFKPSALTRAAEKASVSFTGWPFIFIHYNRQDCLFTTDDGIEGTIEWQDFAGHDAFDFWRLNESGLFYKKELTAMSGSEPPSLSAQDTVRYFAEAIYCMTRLYESLVDDSEYMYFRAVFLGTRNRALVWTGHGYPSGIYRSQYVANRPNLEVTASRPLADWRAGNVDHAIRMASELMKGFGLEKPNEEQMRTQISNLFERRF